jgi:hypothetical protein
LQELAGAGLFRRVEQPGGRTRLQDPALIQEAHPVRHLAGEAHLVGGDQHRHALFLQIAHQGEHLADEFRQVVTNLREFG